MPRKKQLTPEEIIAAGQDLNRRAAYYSKHPEELEKKREEHRRLEERQIAKRMKKHQPQVTDIQSNGEYVSVVFTLNNGEQVIGCYKRTYWKLGPQKRATAAWKRRIDYWNPGAKDGAVLPRPPAQGESSRS